MGQTAITEDQELKRQKITIVAVVLMCALVVVSVGISFIANWQPERPIDTYVEKTLERALSANKAASQKGTTSVSTNSRSADKRKHESTYAPHEVSVDEESIVKTNAAINSTNYTDDSPSTIKSPKKDSPDFDWINPHESIRNIVLTGEIQDREWVYGWLQL